MTSETNRLSFQSMNMGALYSQVTAASNDGHGEIGSSTWFDAFAANTWWMLAFPWSAYFFTEWLAIFNSAMKDTINTQDVYPTLK